MDLCIDGVTRSIPRDQEMILLNQLQYMVMGEYEKLASGWRMMGKPIAREILRSLEDRVRATQGKEAALVIRPPKGADPVVHLSGFMIAIIQEAMKRATISISTDADSVAALSFSIEGPSPGGGQMAVDGNFGEREDDRIEVS